MSGFVLTVTDKVSGFCHIKVPLIKCDAVNVSDSECVWGIKGNKETRTDPTFHMEDLPVF